MIRSSRLVGVVVVGRPLRHHLYRRVATKSAVQASAAAAAAAAHPTTVLLSPLILQHHHNHNHRSQHINYNNNNNGSSSSPFGQLLSPSARLPSQPPASGWKKCIVSSTCLPTKSTSTTTSSTSTSTLTQFSTDAFAGLAPTSVQQQPIERNDNMNDRIDLSSTSSSSSSSSTATMTKDGTSSSPASNMDDLLLQVDMEELKDLASKRCTPLSLKDMYKYAVVDADKPDQRLLNAQFLHKELPIRMAQRAYDLLTLPHGLNEAPAILQVARVYLLYLEQFQDCPVPNTIELEDRFTDMLQGMVLERSSIPNAIARGVDDWIEQYSQSSAVVRPYEERERIREMDEALYRFFTARVGLRFLTEHHILSSPTRATSTGSSALRKAQSSFATIVPPPSSSSSASKTTTTSSPASRTSPSPPTTFDQQQDSTSSSSSSSSFLGCIQTNCEPVVEVRKVVDTVRKQTEDYYGLCPEIQIVDAQQFQQHNGRRGKDKSSHHHNFTYVPHHLHYMVSELVKNSCRATVERHLNNPGTPLGTIKVVIVKGAQDVTIKVADRGGGIPRSKMSKIWRFAHSTATDDENESEFGVDEVTGTQIRGFGLPLARIYARYLGGELTLKSMEGYGVDAYLHLPRLGDACENLPLPVKFSPSNLSSNAPRGAARNL